MPHIILIGFKNVGKSSVGRLLAKALGLPFSDSDTMIQELYRARAGRDRSCREIMRQEGEEFFRALEHEALLAVLGQSPPRVISVGGGAPLLEKNQALIIPHTVIHVTAPKGVVFERIMINGWPAFFPRDADPYLSFQKIWSERLPVLERLAHLTIDNSASLEETVQNLKERLAQHQPAAFLEQPSV